MMSELRWGRKSQQTKAVSSPDKSSFRVRGTNDSHLDATVIYHMLLEMGKNMSCDGMFPNCWMSVNSSTGAREQNCYPKT